LGDTIDILANPENIIVGIIAIITMKGRTIWATKNTAPRIPAVIVNLFFDSSDRYPLGAGFRESGNGGGVFMIGSLLY